MMKPENITSPEDMVRYIEGCLNDFEANISTKAETIRCPFRFDSVFSNQKDKRK